MAVGSPLLRPNAEDTWTVLCKFQQLWQRCVALSKPKLVVLCIATVLGVLCLLHLVTTSSVKEQAVARNAADVSNQTRVDMACLCGGNSTVRSVRAVEACCREAATGDPVAHQVCLGDVETCVALNPPTSSDWSFSALCLITICPKLAPFCRWQWDQC
ncbi:unnamed protein product [Symbiodinium sp. KB8]|nr:unnamed protein product [Symbiodinium sp. KB8]